MKRDDLYKRMAEEYMERQGRELRAELEALSREEDAPATPRLDQRVRAFTNRDKRLRFVRGGALVAACLLLVLVVPRMTRPAEDRIRSALPQMAEIMEDEDAEMEMAAEEALDEEDDVPMADQAAEAPGEEAILPLTFSLPENFQVGDVKVDQGESIYYLFDANRDDVVLTLAADATLPEEPDLVPLAINQHPAYARSTGDYNYLTFEASGVRYTLTCRYDLNTLLALSRSIL